MHRSAFSSLRGAWAVHAGYLLLLALAVGALYGPYLSNPIVFDDLPFFLLGNDGSLPLTAHRLQLLELRSLPTATLAWTQAVWGQELLYFRLGNLLLHLAVASATYGLVLQLRGTIAAQQSRQDRRLACIVALLVALNPVAVYAVGYLVQRSTLMATLFSLLAMSACLRAQVHDQVQQHARWWWLSALFYYLAVFSKEHALMLMLVLPLLTIYLHADWRRHLWAARWPLLVMLATALLATTMRRHLLGTAYEVGASQLIQQHQLTHPWLDSVLTQCWLFFKYLGLWLLPATRQMSVDLREPISGAWPTPYMLAPLLFLAWGGVGLLLLLRRGRRGLCGLAMLYPWLLFWSELVSVRIQEPFVLYRSYLWLVGSLCFAAAVPLAALAAPKRRVLLACLVMVVYFGLSVERLRTFAHPLLLWDDAEKLVHGRTDLPGAARIYYNRGTELSKLQRWDAAMKDLQRAVQLQEDFPYAYGNLGACYLHAGQWAQARDMFSKAIAQRVQNQEPLEVRFYIGRASAYAQLQEPAKARADYQVACKVAGVECDK